MKALEIRSICSSVFIVSIWFTTSWGWLVSWQKKRRICMSAPLLPPLEISVASHIFPVATSKILFLVFKVSSWLRFKYTKKNSFASVISQSFVSYCLTFPQQEGPARPFPPPWPHPRQSLLVSLFLSTTQPILHPQQSPQLPKQQCGKRQLTQCPGPNLAWAGQLVSQVVVVVASQGAKPLPCQWVSPSTPPQLSSTPQPHVQEQRIMRLPSHYQMPWPESSGIFISFCLVIKLDIGCKIWTAYSGHVAKWSVEELLTILNLRCLALVSRVKNPLQWMGEIPACRVTVCRYLLEISDRKAAFTYFWKCT